MSPRAFSSRQGVGVLSDFVQLLFAHGSEIVGTGYCVISKRPCVVRRDCGITSGTFGPPAPTVKGPPGSPGFGSVKPAEGKKEQLAIWLKSPVRSAMVGTWPVRTIPSIRLFHSWDQKKKILSF